MTLAGSRRAFPVKSQGGVVGTVGHVGLADIQPVLRTANVSLPQPGHNSCWEQLWLLLGRIPTLEHIGILGGGGVTHGCTPPGLGFNIVFKSLPVLKKQQEHKAMKEKASSVVTLPLLVLSGEIHPGVGDGVPMAKKAGKKALRGNAWGKIMVMAAPQTTCSENH